MKHVKIPAIDMTSETKTAEAGLTCNHLKRPGRKTSHEPYRRRPIVSKADRDPRHHTQKMKMRLQEMVDHLRGDIGKVEEPQLKAMFETAAEVLIGLRNALSDYEQKNEMAWR